jgi:hypothetical protein
MKIVLRMLLGAILGILAWAISFFFSDSLVVSSAWPASLRTHYPDLIANTSKILVVTPCVVALGAIFRRMFSSHRTLCAMAAMSVALVAESTATLFPPGSWELVVLPFLFGPAAVAYLLDLLRSNSRSSRT